MLHVLMEELGTRAFWKDMTISDMDIFKVLDPIVNYGQGLIWQV